MARRSKATEDEGGVAVAEREDEVTETASEPTESAATENKEKADKPSDEEVEAAIAPFLEVVETAVAARDESTGNVPDEQVAEINKSYANLDGAKFKNPAKRAINDKMKDAMNSMDIVLARAYMEVNEKLTASAPKKGGKGRVAREPVDPTEAFVERVAALNLAYNLAVGNPPEAVADDFENKASELVGSVDQAAIVAYRTWFESDTEDKGEAPESATPLIIAAVKLSLGRAAKPGKAAKRVSEGGGGSTYDGPRRDIAKHIAQAFADQASGTFLKIAEIRKFTSDEYGDDHPSAGAISARLFPKNGKCTLEGVSPSTNDAGDKGGVKN